MIVISLVANNTGKSGDEEPDSPDWTERWRTEIRGGGYKQLKEGCWSDYRAVSCHCLLKHFTKTAFVRFWKGNMVIFSLALLLLSVHWSWSQKDPLLPFSEHLDLEHKVRLKWGFDEIQGTVLFELTVNTSGWVGFGFSPKGGMTGADIVIGGVGPKGSYFTVKTETDNCHLVELQSILYFLIFNSLYYFYSYIWYIQYLSDIAIWYSCVLNYWLSKC